MLSYSAANTKTKQLLALPEFAEFLATRQKLFSFDLLSGHSCPYSRDCHARVIQENGKRKLVDGKDTEFRCFSASQEVLYKNVYNVRSNNLTAMKTLNGVWAKYNALKEALSEKAGIVRIHVAGDFFCQDYFDAWILMAQTHPNRLFYAYTKSLIYWVNRLDILKQLNNFVLTASMGGRLDYLIRDHNLRYAKVVFSEEEAAELGLEIDHDDSHAANPKMKNQNFALLIHGVQMAGSKASVALQKVKKKFKVAQRDSDRYKFKRG